MDQLDTKDRASVLDAFASPAPRGELVPAGGFPQQQLAEVGRPIGAQAVAVHRDEATILQKLRALASAAGDDWYYRIPVKKKVKDEATGRETWVQDYIEGASIKLANDLARMYGNCEIETRVVDVGQSWLIYARFSDLETGFSMTRPFQQRKGQKALGTKDDGRALDIALQIGVSKSIRNVIVNALQTFADFAFEEAKDSLIEKIGKKLPAWKERVELRLSERKIDMKRAEIVLGRAFADWRAADVAKVVALIKSIDDGMSTTDDTFPALEADKTADEGEGDKGQGEGAKPAGADLKEFAEGERKGAPAAEGKPAAPIAGEAAGKAADAASDEKAESPAADKQTAAIDWNERGKAARAKGMSRKAIPGELREKGREADQEAYLAGFDAGEAPAKG